MKERYIASMVLCGTGDAMGYYHGEIEFCTKIKKILEMIDTLSNGKGVMALDISGDDWLVSDGKKKQEHKNRHNTTHFTPFIFSPHSTRNKQTP